MRQKIEQELQAGHYEPAQAILTTWFAEQRNLILTGPASQNIDPFLNDLIQILHQLLIQHHLANNSLKQAEAFYKEWSEKIAEFNKPLAASYIILSHNQCCLVNIQ